MSLTVGLLLWLVLACFGLARRQQHTTLQLQRAAARSVLGEPTPVLSAGTSLSDALASRPALQAMVDSSGRHVLLDGTAPAAASENARPVVSAGPTNASIITQAIATALGSAPVVVHGLPPTLVVDPAVRRGAVALAPVGPQLLLAFVVALLAITTTIGGALLVRLRREHRTAHLRSTFASAVSHELRTPLAQILLFAETLRLGRTRREADPVLALEADVQEARRLMRLVDNVLRVSRLQQGPPPCSRLRWPWMRRCGRRCSSSRRWPNRVRWQSPSRLRPRMRCGRCCSTCWTTR